MTRRLRLVSFFALILVLLSACGVQQTLPPSSASISVPAATFDTTKEITVVSREASSGTRGAFDELMKIKVKEGDSEVDKLFAEAVITDSSDAIASKVEVDKYIEHLWANLKTWLKSSSRQFPTLQSAIFSYFQVG